MLVIVFLLAWVPALVAVLFVGPGWAFVGNCAKAEPYRPSQSRARETATLVLVVHCGSRRALGVMGPCLCGADPVLLHDAAGVL